MSDGSNSCCKSPDPQPRTVGQRVGIVCLNCKLSVSERQLWLVLEWHKKIRKMQEVSM